MALTSLDQLTSEHLRTFVNGEWQDVLTPALTDILSNPARMFYCPTCDAMVELVPIKGFREAPWRRDVIKLNRPNTGTAR